jgi:SAM-dependent methyltransferase
VRPVDRFSDRVDDYERFRPRYPPAVLDILRDEIGLAPDWIVADVGAGTGISAEPFLDHGNPVCAVEPNAEMRAAAQRRLGHRPGFRTVDGTAEATTLDDDSVDLVVCAQAFHWFDPDAARREFARVLRPPRPVALIWNTRVLDATPFLRDYERLLVDHGTDYVKVRHDRIDARRLDRFFAGAFARRFVDNAQRLDHEALTGRVLSASYTPPAGDPRRAAMLADLDRIFHRHNVGGLVTLHYNTEVYVGTLAGDG